MGVVGHEKAQFRQFLAFVQQGCDALPRQQLPRLALPLDPFGAAAKPDRVLQFLQLGYQRMHVSAPRAPLVGIRSRQAGLRAKRKRHRPTLPIRHRATAQFESKAAPSRCGRHSSQTPKKRRCLISPWS